MSAGGPHSLDSDSELAAPSRLSLLLERRCLLPSCGRRKRPGLRPPVLGLLEGLLLLLREGADLRLEAGEAAGGGTLLKARFTTELRAAGVDTVNGSDKTFD